MVRLNIGGKKFITTAGTLTGNGVLNNYFHTLLSGSIPSTKIDGGWFFIDRNGDYFAPILDFLRTGDWFCPDSLPEELVLREANFYRISIAPNMKKSPEKIIATLNDWVNKERTGQIKKHAEVLRTLENFICSTLQKILEDPGKYSERIFRGSTGISINMGFFLGCMFEDIKIPSAAIRGFSNPVDQLLQDLTEGKFYTSRRPEKEPSEETVVLFEPEFVRLWKKLPAKTLANYMEEKHSLGIFEDERWLSCTQDNRFTYRWHNLEENDGYAIPAVKICVNVITEECNWENDYWQFPKYKSITFCLWFALWCSMAWHHLLTWDLSTPLQISHQRWHIMIAATGCHHFWTDAILRKDFVVNSKEEGSDDEWIKRKKRSMRVQQLEL